MERNFTIAMASCIIAADRELVGHAGSLYERLGASSLSYGSDYGFDSDLGCDYFCGFSDWGCGSDFRCSCNYNCCSCRCDCPLIFSRLSDQAPLVQPMDSHTHLADNHKHQDSHSQDILGNLVGSRIQDSLEVDSHIHTAHSPVQDSLDSLTDSHLMCLSWPHVCGRGAQRACSEGL
jgi:hypothetical protein